MKGNVWAMLNIKISCKTERIYVLGSFIYWFIQFSSYLWAIQLIHSFRCIRCSRIEPVTFFFSKKKVWILEHCESPWYIAEKSNNNKQQEKQQNWTSKRTANKRRTSTTTTKTTATSISPKRWDNNDKNTNLDDWNIIIDNIKDKKRWWWWWCWWMTECFVHRWWRR